MRRDRFGSRIGGIKFCEAKPSLWSKFCGNITEWRKPLGNVSWQSAKTTRTCLSIYNLVFRFCNIVKLKSFTCVLSCKTLSMF